MNERIIAELKLLLTDPIIKQVVSPYENGTVLDQIWKYLHRNRNVQKKKS